ncbi:MAG: DNA polymerase III subunit delta' [Gallionellales bacterium GWA2_60_18]|nr:MAG: DNA polymerase III subunit delta' [Gallionellales bacterium GWA2_60_18]
MKSIYPWQESDWERLRELRKRPLSGLLFKGSQGIGKLDLALSFARSLLCQQLDESGFACGQCPSCHWFSQGSHPDFRLLQPEALSQDDEEGEGGESEKKSGKKPSKQISVDQVRALADFIGMSAHQGGGRVVVIHPAEAMNLNAANALLKNLEEPPQGLLFILVSHKPQQLLPTILSRCLSFALAAPDATSAGRWLAQQGVKNPAEALAASGFAPLQAVQMDEQLGSGEREKLLCAVRQPAALDVFALADALQKTEQVLVVQWLQQWCYDLGSMKQAGRLRYHPGEEAAIRKLVEPVDPLNIARLQKYLQTAKREARHTLNPKLFFESLLFSYRQLMLE